MQTQTLGTHSWEADNAIWPKALWIAAVTLTLGLCLFAWKRPVTQEIVVTSLAVAAVSPMEDAYAVPVKMTVQVKKVRLKPVWASALSETGIMEEEYPQARTRTGA